MDHVTENNSDSFSSSDYKRLVQVYYRHTDCLYLTLFSRLQKQERRFYSAGEVRNVRPHAQTHGAARAVSFILRDLL